MPPKLPGLVDTPIIYCMLEKNIEIPDPDPGPSITESTRTTGAHAIVIGSGFGGLAAAVRLGARAKIKDLCKLPNFEEGDFTLIFL